MKWTKVEFHGPFSLEDFLWIGSSSEQNLIFKIKDLKFSKKINGMEFESHKFFLYNLTYKWFIMKSKFLYGEKV